MGEISCIRPLGEKRRHPARAASIATACWLAATAPGLAQVAATVPAAGVATPSQTGAPTSAPSDPVAPAPGQVGREGGLTDIVVTARQRSENLQDTPLSIAAINGATMSRAGVESIVDLDAKVPSLQFGNTSIRLQTYTGIRGVGDYSRNPGYDNRAGIYLDGVLMGRSAATDYPVFDIERVEVLRGPQGTLFGKDALTGVINITTVKPQFEDRFSAQAEVGSRSLFAGQAVANTQLADNVALRISVSGRGQDGYYFNRYDRSWVGGGTIIGGRGQLRWRPGGDTTVDLSFDAVRDDATVLLGGTPLTGPGVPFTSGGRDFSQNNTTRRLRNIYGVGLNVEHQLGAFTLTSITAYRTSRNDVKFNDFDLSPQEQGRNRFLDRSRAFSQEVRLASPGGDPFNYVIGAFYYDQVASSDWVTTLGPDFRFPLLLTDISRVPSQTAALFGHATWKPVELITIDAGARLNYTHKSIRFDQILGTPPVLGYINIPNYRDSLSETNVNPMVSVMLNPTRDVHAYATYSSGDRPGGWNPDIVKSANISFDAESARNYEIGLKTELFERRLRFNIAGYIMKFRDFQVTQLTREGNNPIVPQLTNAGRVTSKGVEADFELAPFTGFNLSGGFAYNDARYDSFKNGGGIGVNYDGNRLIEAPKWTASTTATYEVPLVEDWNGLVSLTYTYKSSTFADPSNAARFRQDSFNVLNGEVSLLRDEGGLKVSVFGRNIANTTYREAAFSTALGYNYVALNEPRVIGVRLGIRR